MSTWGKVVPIAGGLLVVAALVVGAFGLGVRVGEMRAQLGLGTPAARAWLASHGVYGVVEQVDLEGRAIVVAHHGGSRRLVLFGDDTVLERQRRRIHLAEVEVEDRVVAIGAPDAEGRIVARVVRVLGGRQGEPGSLWPEAVAAACRLGRLALQLLAWLLWRRGI